MSEPMSTPNRRRSSLGRVLILLLLLLLGGGAAWYFLVPPPTLSLPPFVQITAPQTGEMTEINSPLTIQASAEGPESFKRLELYADGALVAVENSTLAGGSNPLIFLQSYTPLTLGRHVLMVRGYVTDDNFADSGVVYLDVIEASTTPQIIDVDTIPISEGVLPSLNEVAALSGIPPDQLQGANPALNGVDPAQPLPPGMTLTVPPRPAPSAPTGSTPPKALASSPIAPKALSLDLDCASAKLTWVDKTSDETGFVVYRLAPGETKLNRVAILPANTTTYSDTLPVLGTYYYQVAATRGGLESLSLMPSAATPEACVQPAAAFETVVLSVLSLDTTEAYDGVYCYFDINGSGYQRAPTADFVYFRPDADGLTYNLARQLPNHGQFVLAVPPGEGVVTLGGECWGQRGPTASPLGSPFNLSHARNDWNGRNLIQTALNNQGKPGAAIPASVRNQLRLVYRLSDNTPNARREAIAGQFAPGAIRAVLDPVGLEPVYGPSIFFPPIDLRIENSCEAYDPDPAGRWGCAWRTLGRGEPTLYWDWIPSGVFEERLLDRYEISVRRISADGNATPFWTPYTILRQGTGPIRRIHLLEGLGNQPCGQRLEIKMQALISSRLASPYSSPITWLTTDPCPDGPRPEVTIKFESIDVGIVYDDPEPLLGARTDTLELTGSIRVDSQPSRWLVHSLNRNDNYWVDAGPGAHEMSRLLFTLPNPFTNTPPSRYNRGINFYVRIARGNQTITISSDIYDLDPSWLAVGIDPNSVGTGACGGSTVVGPFTATEWSTLDQVVTLGGRIPGEPCTVKVHVTGHTY